MKNLLRIAGFLIISALITGCFYKFFVKKRYLDVIHTNVANTAFSTPMEITDWYFEHYHIPAISVGIVSRERKIQYISKGSLSRRNDAPVTENTFFRISSVSKSLTGVLCKSMGEKGIIDLEKPISEYLKDELDVESLRKLNDLNLQQLLLHSSGIEKNQTAYTETEMKKALREMKLISIPGEEWNYSNFGYSLITFVLEKTTGSSFEELVKLYLSEEFEVQGLKVALSEAEIERTAKGYRKDFRIFDAETIDYGLQTSGSGMYSNMESLIKIMECQLEVYEKDERDSPLFVTDKKIKCWDENYYGFGIFEFNIADLSNPGHPTLKLAHGGDGEGYVCYYAFFPEKGFGYILMSSSGGAWFWEMEQQFEKYFLSEN